MRVAILGLMVVSSTTSGTAFGDPAERLEASGYVGVDYFGDDIGLGDSLAPEQRPQTAPSLGARLTYIALRTTREIPISFGGELEASFTPSWTGYGFVSERPSVFAPVFGYRALLLFRLGDGWFQPHVVGGIGGATVASSSAYMKQDTDLVFMWGLGATLPMSDRWQLRFDVRQGRTEARDSGMTSTYELMLGIGARFGLPRTPAPPRLEPEPEPEGAVAAKVTLPPPPDVDTDGDGLPDKLDACPREPELVNGIDDQDGCPEADPDGDHIVGALDKCPDRAEDFDGWQDDDGCPDDDNDNDGIVDAKDACPREAETKNGFADDDGCPDQLPAGFVAALGSGAKVKFASKATLTPASKTALDMSIAAMLSNPKITVAVTAHPEDPTPVAAELAAKRADAVKWYLIEQGVAQKQLVTKVGAVAKAPVIELSVAP